MIQICTNPNGLLEIMCPYIYCGTHFQAHPRRICFSVGKGSTCYKRITPLLLIRAKDRWLSALESDTTLWFLQMLGFL